MRLDFESLRDETKIGGGLLHPADDGVHFSAGVLLQINLRLDLGYLVLKVVDCKSPFAVV